MNKNLIKYPVIAMLTASSVCLGCSINCSPKEYASTEAGNIDFQFLNYIKLPSAFHKIEKPCVDDHNFTLTDGSKWSTCKNEFIQGWEKSDRLIITQNEAIFSLYRFALINPDLKQAVPISLVTEATPNHAEVLFIAHIHSPSDLVTLSDGKKFVVHAHDRRILDKMRANDRVMIGANTNKVEPDCPYILIDTYNEEFVRATVVE